MKKKQTSDFNYEGKDLESMDFAVKYHQWILEGFRPYLGKTVVEVGAGSGSFTRLLAETGAKSVIAIEPSKEMFPLLQDTTKELGAKLKAKALKGFFSQVSGEIKNAKPNSVLYVNVFEHIEKDEEELRLLYDTIPMGGRVCIFVPANQWLMSNFDRKIGHFRRYSKNELRSKVKEAGFEIEMLKKFDSVGIFPWLVKYRLLGSTTMEAGLTKIYDNVVVPIESRVEKVIPPLWGKNLILVAKKK